MQPLKPPPEETDIKPDTNTSKAVKLKMRAARARRRGDAVSVKQAKIYEDEADKLLTPTKPFQVASGEVARDERD